MTRPTNARVAGLAFLLYIAAGITSMRTNQALFVDVILSFVMCACALGLGVTLFGVTADEDRDIAMMGLVCRVAEGVVGIAMLSMSLALRSPDVRERAHDPAALQALDTVFSGAGRLNVPIGGFLFAVGSTMFCWLLLRGRLIPAALAWLGLAASVLLVAGLPLQLGGIVPARVAMLMWMPMAAFEIPVGVWFLLKGVRIR
jgi:hypothetical protein